MIPISDEVPDCPLCGASRDGIVVGSHGRFGMQVRNIACEVCGLVYVTPRPSHAAMMDYYRGTYREHYGEVRYPMPSGGSAGPGDPEYQAALDVWHENQAANALALSRPQPGARVLEIGCRHARTLQLMRERADIRPFGIEPGPAEAQAAEQAGVPCFQGTLEEYPEAEPFDQIQLFHVLEHFHDPLSQLVRLRGLLAPEGKLLIEVPNVVQPYGLLEENFFQNVHLVSFSPNTLAAMCQRAGLAPLRVISREALFLVATPDPDAPAELPLPFDRSTLPDPTEDAAWVAERLWAYAELEKARVAIHAFGPTMEALESVVSRVARPAFPDHVGKTVADLAEFFMTHGSARAACVIATAAAAGPHPPDMRAAFQRLAQATAQNLAPAAQ